MSTAVNGTSAIDFEFWRRNNRKKNIFSCQWNVVDLFEDSESVSLDNKEVNQENLQETAELISLVQSNQPTAEVSGKTSAEVANARYMQQIYTKLLGKDGGILAELSEPSSEMIIAALLGIDSEVDGNALKKGVGIKEGFDLQKTCSAYLAKVLNKVQNTNNIGAAAGIDTVSESESVNQTKALNSIKDEKANVFGNGFVVLIGSVISAIGRVICTFGEIVATIGRICWNLLIALIDGDKDLLEKTLKEASGKYKKLSMIISEKVKEVHNITKNLVDSMTQKVGDGTQSVANEVTGIFKFWQLNK